MQALDLNEAQRTQIQALRTEMQEDLAPVREDLGELRSQMQQLWSAESPDRTAILALGERMDALHGVMRDRRSEFRTAFLGVLTAEQRTQLGELRERRGESRGRRGPRAERGEDGDSAGPGNRGPRAGRGNRGPRAESGDRGPRGQRMAQRLNLNEAQQAQVRALRTQMREELAPVHQQMRSLREAARAQMTSGQPDSGALAAIHGQLDGLRSTIREERVDFRLAFLELLTPEQRAQLAENPRRGGGHHGRRGPRGHGRRGGGGPGGTGN